MVEGDGLTDTGAFSLGMTAGRVTSVEVVCGVVLFSVCLTRQQIPMRRNSQHKSVPSINETNNREMISRLAISKVYAVAVL